MILKESKRDNKEWIHNNFIWGQDFKVKIESKEEFSKENYFNIKQINLD